MNKLNDHDNDAQDRLTDRFLAEAVGDEHPPDLSAEIESCHADRQAVPRLAEGKTIASRRAWIALLTTAASLMIGVVVWRSVDRVEGEPSVAMVESEPEISSSRSISNQSLLENSGSKSNELPKQQQPSASEGEINTPPTVAINGLVLERSNGTSSETAIPEISYEPSPETRARLKARDEQKIAARRSLAVNQKSKSQAIETQRQLDRRLRVPKQTESLNTDGPPLPSPYFLTDDVQYDAPSAAYRESVANRHKPGFPSRPTFGFQREPTSGDQYASINENEFTKPAGTAALSTFSIDVDTASYTNVRRFLMQDRRLPPAAGVRIEELVNYFDYDYDAPSSESEDPFTAAMEVAACPWKPKHRLVRIGIKGRVVEAQKRPLSNLVFLVDVSGSMNSSDKLPLVVEGLKALTERLGENDRVAIVVYAGAEGVVLRSTSGMKQDEIRSALGRLQAGGSTAGGAGLKLAYKLAEQNKIPGGVNRVVLCTDGDFNVGVTGTDELAKLVEARGKEAGIFLTVLGFGRGNLNDEMLETISGRGDGHYAYIDSEREARRVLSRDLSGTLVTIAKDVKLQVEFNPAKVASYRLLGYENRVMAAKDFNDDTKDAGEIGAGHTVTALYEIVPVGVEEPTPPVDGLKYQADWSTVEEDAARETSEATIDEKSDEMLTLKIRYKQPAGGASKKLEFPLKATSDDDELDSPSDDFRWATAVAEFGMLLRGSSYAGEASYDHVLETARGALGDDAQGYRAEFLDLVRRARELSDRE